MYKEKTLIENSVDDLVKKGVDYIRSDGRHVETHNGNALQADNVTYVLTDCRNRIHTLRYDKSVKYFARELLAYFYGSLDVNAQYGLGYASTTWKRICDENGMINSNYGYYIFHQLTADKITQLQWIREQFIKNPDTRKAYININNIQHKINTKDFPCTVGLLFRRENNHIDCDVHSRSTDIITGLPYDMGFFSLVLELVTGLVASDLKEKLEPGYVAMHSSYTQIYDKTKNYADFIERANCIEELQQMPKIDNAKEFLTDIYNLGKEKPKTKVMKWCITNAK